jgi:hypothetical protein
MTNETLITKTEEKELRNIIITRKSIEELNGEFDDRVFEAAPIDKCASVPHYSCKCCGVSSWHLDIEKISVPMPRYSFFNSKKIKQEIRSRDYDGFIITRVATEDVYGLRKEDGSRSKRKVYYGIPIRKKQEASK